MGDSIPGQVGPFLRRGARFEPWAGEAAPSVFCQEDHVVRSVMVEGAGLYRGGKTGCGGVDLRCRAHYSAVGQSSLVSPEQVHWEEAGFYCQDIGWAPWETVCIPSGDLVPKDW